MSYGRGGVLYTSAIHILQYGRGVAGRLGVAYRRHADVRRSANDWSIVTRRFSLAFSPFPSVSLSSPSRKRDLHAPRACARSYADPPRSSRPHQQPRIIPPRVNPSKLGRPIAPLLLRRRVFKGGSFYIRMEKWRTPFAPLEEGL